MTRAGGRLLGTLAGLALTVGADGRGQCFMQVVAAPAQAGTSAEHDCCKTGLTGGTPSCCHADMAPSTVARLKSASATALPAPLSWVLPLPVVVAAAQAAAISVASCHSPPPTVLRI